MIWLVTSNEGKFREIDLEMRKHGIGISWKKAKYSEIQGNDNYEISLRSCQDMAKTVHGTFFLEDTGLYCQALKGFPGPYAKYAYETIGPAGLIRQVGGLKRDAYFLTVVTLHHGGKNIQFDGKLEGTISSDERGGNGFGFDPVFIPKGEERTLAEMTAEEKNGISHRAIAIRILIGYLEENKIQ